jgi:hypothetical protein
MHLHEKESHDTELKGSDMKLIMWEEVEKTSGLTGR